MANIRLFRSGRNRAPAADAVNSEGSPAYSMSAEHSLAQYALTGCLNGTFYASATTQLETILELCANVPAEFIAKTAIYARKEGYMKDVPALLCAILTQRDQKLLAKTFIRVIDNGRMLRSWVQIIRSGQIGRKSLGSGPRRLVRTWLESRTGEELFKDSVGRSPSIADILRMTHPTPSSKEKAAMYGYLLGRTVDLSFLPDSVREYENFKAGRSKKVPRVAFQKLTALELDQKAWKEIALSASWQTLRMNLNTFGRHGVFSDKESVSRAAERLRDPQEIARARVFPYQLLAAFRETSGVPLEIREALQDAMETATANVPEIEGQIYICPDVSGSMASPVTGSRKGASTKVRCVDAAALMTAAIVRKNSQAAVIPFEDRIRLLDLNPRDSVMTNATKLAAIGGGGTNVSAPLAMLNKKKAVGHLVVIVSDNQSWVDSRAAREGTRLMEEWNIFHRRNPGAKLVCIDIQPNRNTQAQERADILNVGGFSDQVFRIISGFAKGQLSSEHWVREVKRVEL